MTIKIYGVRSSRSFRVTWAAEEAGIEYEYIDLKFGSNEVGGNLHEDYLAINPQGKVPSIVDGDFVLTESAAIVNYIAAKNQEANLIPKDGTRDRGRYDEICYFILAELEQPLWNTGKHKFALPKEYRVPGLLDKTTQYEFDKAQNALQVILGDRQYAIGDHFTMADVLLFQTLEWAVVFKFKLLDSLYARYQSYKGRDALLKARADT